MKKLLIKYRSIIASVALVFATIAVNSTCAYALYQDEIPQQAKKLRKF